MRLFRRARGSSLSAAAAEGDVAALIEDLSVGRDDLERLSAAKSALAELGGAAKDPLIAAVRDRRSPLGVRLHAVDLLGQLNDPEATDAIIEAAHDRDPLLRQTCLGALRGASGNDPRLAASLAKLIKDKDTDVRRTALSVLASLEPPPPADIARPVVATVVAALDKVTHLDKDAPMCSALINALAGLGADDALIAALSRDNWRVSSMAAQALGHRRVEEAVDPLVAALSDSSDSVRIHAAQALEKIGGARAQAALAEHRARQ